MKKVILLSKLTSKLSKKEIQSIVKLKNSFWRWRIDKQLLWFKEKVQKTDKNILLLINNKLVGYTLMRKRKFYNNKKLIKFFYVDTVLIKKRFRGKNLAADLILFVNKIINKSKKHSFLTCQKENISFYKKFDWKTLPKNKFKIMDHKPNWFENNSSINGMTYNLKRKSKDKFLYYFN